MQNVYEEKYMLLKEIKDLYLKKELCTIFMDCDNQ